MSNQSGPQTNDGWETVAPRRKPRKAEVVNRPIKSSDTFVIMLVGLPGSGKSSFATTLSTGDPERFVRICQDLLKTRKKCESTCRRALRDGKIAVIDRCNFDDTQRENFTSIAAEYNVPVDCVVFNYSVETCVLRCESRSNHETIESHMARGVVKKMASMFKPPSITDIYRSLSEVTHYREADAIASNYLQRRYIDQSEKQTA